MTMDDDGSNNDEVSTVYSIVVQEQLVHRDLDWICTIADILNKLHSENYLSVRKEILPFWVERIPTFKHKSMMLQ
jgi:hypothetical protein